MALALDEPASELQPTNGQAGSGRFVVIDGIRGWAAFVVLLYHVVWTLAGGIFPGIQSAWLYLPLNGELAVFIFFILSGDALSTPFFRRRDERVIARLFIKRYPRLTIPIVCSCSIAFWLKSTGMTYNSVAGNLINSPYWLGGFLNFSPSFVRMLSYSFGGVYLHPHVKPYNDFLWTMQVEFVGSILVFCLLFSIRFVRRPIILTSSAFAVSALFAPIYAGFFLGMAFAFAREELRIFAVPDKYVRSWKGLVGNGIQIQLDFYRGLRGSDVTVVFLSIRIRGVQHLFRECNIFQCDVSILRETIFSDISYSIFRNMFTDVLHVRQCEHT